MTTKPKESKPQVKEVAPKEESSASGSESGSESEDYRPIVRDGRQHDEEYLKEKDTYRAWKHQRKQKLKQESYRQHSERRGHTFESDASDQEDYESYMDYRHRHMETKKHHKKESKKDHKKASKHDKHYKAPREHWTSHESPEHYRRAYEAEYEEVRPRHHRRSHSFSDSEESTRERHDIDYQY